VNHPHLHIPRLVRSSDLKSGGLLDLIADAVSAVVGDMRIFLSVCIFIACWMVVGVASRFDPVPWPLLLMVMNIPQLPIMISLQVSANRAERQRDAKAETDHETLTAIHQINVQQSEILRRLDAAAKEAA
jgi:uncharacterized membrane protein